MFHNLPRVPNYCHWSTRFNNYYAKNTTAPSSVIKYVKLATEGTIVSGYEYKTKGGNNGINLVLSAPHYALYLSAHAGNKTGTLNVKVDCKLLYKIYFFPIKFFHFKMTHPAVLNYKNKE
jgi:hypothetical protein